MQCRTGSCSAFLGISISWSDRRTSNPQLTRYQSDTGVTSQSIDRSRSTPWTPKTPLAGNAKAALRERVDANNPTSESRQRVILHLQVVIPHMPVTQAESRVEARQVDLEVQFCVCTAGVLREGLRVDVYEPLDAIGHSVEPLDRCPGNEARRPVVVQVDAIYSCCAAASTGWPDGDPSNSAHPTTSADLRLGLKTNPGLPSFPARHC